MAHSSLPSRIWTLPSSLPDDLAAFEKNVDAFKAGTLSPTQFLVFRVPQGVYEQRETGAYMLRVRFPAGVVLPHQMRRLAEVATQYGDGVLHVTTRQDIQIHRVSIDGVHPALTALAEAGLSTKGGGGNTVRNITGCPGAGVCPNEAFDVTPHVVRLTELLLRDAKSFQLPRKYKIAFSGCEHDCAGVTVSDLGFIAKVRDGVPGFAVYVGGGLGAASRVADKLEDFVPVSEATLIAEAIKRVFDANGNRRDKRQARIRFLVRQLGFDTFRRKYEDQLSLLRRERIQAPALAADSPMVATTKGAPLPAGSDQDPAFAGWLTSNVRPQRQPGYFQVIVPLPLGDIAAANLKHLADVIERHGDKCVRATQRQNLVLHWVGGDELAALYHELATVGLGASPAPVRRDLVVCTGASTCKLGICLSRGLARAIDDALSKRPAVIELLGTLEINISGCPNSCGRHPIAHIGLHGAARRIDGRLVPHYTILLGGRVEEGRTVLASPRGTVPAKRVPEFIADLLTAFAESPQRPDFHAFVNESDVLIKQLVSKHQSVPSFTEDKNFYYDWDAEIPFSLAGRGPGECGAGVYDLIDVDLKSAAEALTQQRWFAAATLASRALLVTRGEQANNDGEAFALFRKHFVDDGLIEPKHGTLLDVGGRAAVADNPTAAFASVATDAPAFVAAVQALFLSMDASLHFPKRAEACNAPLTATLTARTKTVTVDVEKDFRGVVCPLNYVKTKMALDRMKPGQVLAVLLDADGARNVPESAQKDGHTIVAITQENSCSRVTIRKKG